MRLFKVKTTTDYTSAEIVMQLNVGRLGVTDETRREFIAMAEGICNSLSPDTDYALVEVIDSATNSAVVCVTMTPKRIQASYLLDGSFYIIALDRKEYENGYKS